MTDKLLPCPFCGAKTETLTDGKRTWGLVTHRDGCLFPTWPKHEVPECDFTAWNTRAERTCRWEYPKGVNGWVGYTVCSSCGEKYDETVTDTAHYCPNCGARVVG